VYLYPVDADEQLQLGGNQKCIFQLGTYPKASGKAAELEKPAGKCGVCWCGGRDNRRGLVRGAAMRSLEKPIFYKVIKKQFNKYQIINTRDCNYLMWLQSCLQKRNSH